MCDLLPDFFGFTRYISEASSGSWANRRQFGRVLLRNYCGVGRGKKYVVVLVGCAGPKAVVFGRRWIRLLILLRQHEEFTAGVDMGLKGAGMIGQTIAYS